jgi:uncharacterized protein YegP (UPF0339 family)
MIIEVLKAKDGGWYWRMVGSNGRILSESEIYVRKEGAVKTAAAVGKRSRITVVVKPLLWGK